MRDYFVFDGISSKDFGIYIADGNVEDSPSRSVETYKIPGKNGTLTIDNGRFNNINLSYTVYADQNIVQNISALRAALATKIGSLRLEDTRHPDEFRIARYSSGLKMKSFDKVSGAATITFDCDPQRFLKIGEDEITIPVGGMELLNPTLFGAKPLIKVLPTNTSAVVSVGAYNISIDFAGAWIEIDCETMNAYSGLVSRNGNVTIPDGTEIAPGAQNISLTNISNAIIIPRWWTI